MATGKITRLIEETIEMMGLNEHVTILPGERDFFEDFFEPIKVNRGEYLLKKGEPVEYLYYLEEGLLNICFPDNKGGYINSRFMEEKNFVNFFYMHLDKHNAHYSIKAGTNSKLWRMERKMVKLLYDQSINFNKIARIHLEKSLHHRILREEGLHCMSAQERYEKLFEKERKLLHIIPLKEIASYLSITPQALSKVRKTIIK